MITIKEIIKAQKNIVPYINQTPLIYNDFFTNRFNSRIYFKPENLQLTGSFKIRGALNKILSLTDEEKQKGIITASSGNHALGVSYGAKLTNTRATIIMPENAQQTKVNGVRALGADIIQHGFTATERYDKVYEIQADKGCTLVHSSNDPKVIAGQGTIGLEITKELEDVNTIIVPLGAGALLAGIACAAKELNPGIRVIGVETEAIQRFSISRSIGKPVEVPFKSTIADGLMMTKTFPQIYEMIQTYVDDIITVSDEYIKQAIKEITFRTKLVVEPSAAIGLAAILSGKLQLNNDEKNVIVLTGGNIDPDRFKSFL